MPDRGGSFHAVFIWPIPWPPAQDAPFLESPVGDQGGVLRITATADGCLDAIVFDEGGSQVAHGRIGPVRLTRGRACDLGIHWKEGRFEFYSSGVYLGGDPSQSGRGGLNLALADEEVGEHSIGHPDAAVACSGAMKSRRHTYGGDRASGRGRVLSLEEELDRLDGRLGELEHNTARVRQGHRAALSTVRGILRELTANLGGRHYQPALLRVAGRLDLPLPMFALPKPKRSDDAVRGMTMTQLGEFGTRRTNPAQELVDMQDWLRRTGYVRFGETSKVEDWSYARLLAKAAENLGGAHMGPELPQVVDQLERSSFAGVSNLETFTFRVAELTLELGRYVVQHGREPLVH